LHIWSEMRLKTKGHKKDTLQDSFRNFDKHHGLNYEKNHKGVNKYYKWQKVLDKERLLDALKSQPPYSFVAEKKSSEKENVLPGSICVMKLRTKPKENNFKKMEEKLFESQVIKENEIPLEHKLQEMMDIPLSESVVFSNVVNLNQDSHEESTKMAEEESTKMAEETPILPDEPSPVVEVEKEKENERVIKINLSETLDQISVERTSLSDKQILAERTPSSSVHKMSRSQPIITSPYIDTARRLEDLSENIKKRVRNLNEELSVTKNSISKVREARTQSAKSTPISITSQPFMRFDLNSLVPAAQSSLFRRDDISKENLGDSRNTFAKPSCQKSGYCSSKGSAKKTPLPLKEYLESQPSAEKLCPCRGRTSENLKAEQTTHHGERSSEKKFLNAESGIQVRLNKAEILRMEYIRNKSQTPTKKNSGLENYCALSNEKRGSGAKLKFEDIE